MTIDRERCPDCIINGRYWFEGGNPIAWVIPAGNGRAGYFQEGHDVRTVEDFTAPILDRFMKQMLFYLAGYDTLDVSLSIPGYAKDYSGVSFDPVAMAVFVEKPGYHKVTLHDLAGRTYMSVQGRGTAEYSFEEKRKNLEAGIYFLRADLGAGRVETRRYLVQR